MKTKFFKWFLLAIVVLGIQKINTSITLANSTENNSETIMWYDFNEKEYTMDANVSIAHNASALTGTYISRNDFSIGEGENKKFFFGFRDSMFWNSFISNKESNIPSFNEEYIPGIYINIGNMTFNLDYKYERDTVNNECYTGHADNQLMFIECGNDKFFGTGTITVKLKGPYGKANGYFRGSANMKVQYYENGAAEGKITFFHTKDIEDKSSDKTQTAYCEVIITFKNFMKYVVYDSENATIPSSSSSGSSSTDNLFGGMGSSSGSSSSKVKKKKYIICMPMNYKMENNEYENYNSITVNGKEIAVQNKAIICDDFKNLMAPGITCTGFKIYNDSYGTNNYKEKASLGSVSYKNFPSSIIYCDLSTQKAQTTYIYDANGGELPTENTSFNKRYGEMIGSLICPERKNYKFKGWYTEKNGGTKITISTICKNTTDTTVRLYARWEKETYTVIFTDGKKELKYTSCNVGTTIPVNDVVKEFGFSSSPSDLLTFTGANTNHSTIKAPGTNFNVAFFADIANNGTIRINVSQKKVYNLTITGANGIKVVIKKTDSDGKIFNIRSLAAGVSLTPLMNNFNSDTYSFVTGYPYKEINEWDVTKNPNLEVKLFIKTYEKVCSIPVSLKEESSIKGKCLLKTSGAVDFKIKTTKPMGAPISTIDYEFSDIDLKNNKTYSYVGIIPGFSYRSRTISGSSVSYGVTTFAYLEKIIYYDYVPADNYKANIVMKGMIK